MTQVFNVVQNAKEQGCSLSCLVGVALLLFSTLLNKSCAQSCAVFSGFGRLPSRNTGIKVTSAARPVRTPVAEKTRRSEHGVLTGRECVQFPISLHTEIFFFIVKEFSARTTKKHGMKPQYTDWKHNFRRQKCLPASLQPYWLQAAQEFNISAGPVGLCLLAFMCSSR